MLWLSNYQIEIWLYDYMIICSHNIMKQRSKECFAIKPWNLKRDTILRSYRLCYQFVTLTYLPWLKSHKSKHLMSGTLKMTLSDAYLVYLILSFIFRYLYLFAQVIDKVIVISSNKCIKTFLIKSKSKQLAKTCFHLPLLCCWVSGLLDRCTWRRVCQRWASMASRTLSRSWDDCVAWWPWTRRRGPWVEWGEGRHRSLRWGRPCVPQTAGHLWKKWTRRNVIEKGFKPVISGILQSVCVCGTLRVAAL